MPDRQELNQDLRVVKSRQAMRVAALRLLEEQSFNRITVNDICSAALVSRTTFYQHFQDKYELVRYCLVEAVEELRRKSAGDMEHAVNNLLGFVADHRKVFRNLLSDKNEELLRMLTDMSVSTLRQELEQDVKLEEIPAQLTAIFLAGGMASLLLWWVESDFPISREALAGYLLELFQPPR